MTASMRLCWASWATPLKGAPTSFAQELRTDRQGAQALELSKGLVALKGALELPKVKNDGPAGWSALNEGIKEYELDSAASKKKVLDVLVAVLPPSASKAH